MKIIGTILACFFTLLVKGQYLDPVENYTPKDSKVQWLDTAKIKVPEEFKQQAYLAISHYPELKDMCIKLKYARQKTSMSARPDLNFLFKRRSKRRYTVRIDESLNKKREGILLDDVPFNAQVGVIGHELAHLLDYSSKSKFGIIIMGFKYLFPSYRRKMEQYTDRLTLDHGLGYQLFDWADYVFNRSNCGEVYRKYKMKYYYDDKELLQLMDEDGRY